VIVIAAVLTKMQIAGIVTVVFGVGLLAVDWLMAKKPQQPDSRGDA
jgi:hypothetical protein